MKTNKRAIVVFSLLCCIASSTLAQTPQQLQSADTEQIQKESERLVKRMLDNENKRDLEAQLLLYSDQFTYQGERVTRGQNRKSTSAYYKRWPAANWNLIGPVQTAKGPAPNQYEITYIASFRVESPERGKWSEGTLTSRLTITNTPGGALITAAKDDISKPSKGDLTIDTKQVIRQADVPQQLSLSKSPASEPVPLLQRERVNHAIFASFDKTGVRLAYGDLQGWQVLDLASKKVIAFGSSPNAASPYFGTCFSPNGEVLALVQGGNRGVEPWLELVSLSSPDQRILVESGNSGIVGSYSVTFSANNGIVTFKTGKDVEHVKVNTGISEQQRRVLPTLPRRFAKNSLVWPNDKPFLISLVGKCLRVTELQEFKTILTKSVDDFAISSDGSALLLTGRSQTACYDVSSGTEKWQTKLLEAPLAFAPEGLVAAFQKPNKLSVINIRRPHEPDAIAAGGIISDQQEAAGIDFSPTGLTLAVGKVRWPEGFVSIIDLKRGHVAWSISSNKMPMAPFCFDEDGSHFATARYGGFGSACANVYLVANGQMEFTVEFDTPSYGIRAMSLRGRKLFAAADDDRGIAEINLSAGNPDEALHPTRFFGPSNRINQIGLSLDGNTLFASDCEGFITLWDNKNGKLQLRITSDGQGRPVFFLPTGEYAGITSEFSELGFRFGSRAYPFEQFDLRLNRPDIVLDRLGASPEAITIAKELRERRLKRMGVTEDMLKPDFHIPEIRLASEAPATTDSRDLSLQIKASDSKYPLDRLRVYVNDVPVNGRDGESLRSLNTQSLDRSIPVKLAAGKNKIQISVLNNAGAESLYATTEVTCTAPAAKPNLYLVAMGVSNYANSQFNLKYAAKDAEDLAAKLKARAGSAYGEVKELLLKDGEVTKDALAKVRKFLKPATVDDSVVLFMAGHGLLDDKYDYYFGTSDMNFNNPAGRGIAFDDMDDILADLPSRKKSLLMDTCHAGELDAEEKMVLAAADAAASGVPVQLASNKSVAMRAVGTRGMAIKGIEGAKGKSEWYERISAMFVDLRRGSGSTILSSSAGAEYAFESGEQKNGLFTYAVLEALDGKNAADADKDGKVTMKELCESVKKRVQDLSGGKQTPNTRRLNLESDFPLASK